MKEATVIQKATLIISVITMLFTGYLAFKAHHISGRVDNVVAKIGKIADPVHRAENTIIDEVGKGVKKLEKKLEGK